MLNVVVHVNRIIPWHNRWVAFFISGFKKHDINITVSSSRRRLLNCDVAILFGTNTWKEIEKLDAPYIMVNRKFFGAEIHVAGDLVALSWNGFNGKGFHCAENISHDRIYNFLDPEKEIQDWKLHGTELLLCGQADLGRCTSYKTLEQWYTKVRNITNMPMRFRAHPTRGEQISLEEDLRNVKVAITLNSLVSVEILLLGIPVITMDECSPVYNITGHSIEDIQYPDRLEMLEYLSHCQWHYTEIENGKFWEQLYPKKGTQLLEYKR